MFSHESDTWSRVLLKQSTLSVFFVIQLLLIATGVAFAGDEPAGAEPEDETVEIASAAESRLIEPIPPPATSRTSSSRGRPEFVLLDGPARIAYSRKGLEVKSRSGNYRANIRWRTQIRLFYPFSKDPLEESDFGRSPQSDVQFKRARLKVSGNAFRPWFKVEYEHDLVSGYVLNLAATMAKCEWLQFRAGQWKPDFSRERVTSSGKQQFADRSIVNRDFTVDRQAGFEVLGHLMPGTRGDSWYYAGMFTGNGRGNGFDDDGHPMLLARYQWNFLGEDPGLSSSDIEHHILPAASVAVAGVTNRSRYTRFSGSGGSQLEGFEAGEPGQYSIKQVMGETFLKYRGLSVQSEVHWKHVFDNVNQAANNLRGSYIQGGYFPHGVFDWAPRQLELGYRYAFVDPYTMPDQHLRQEHTVVVNWFFEGHDNKITFDAGTVSLARSGAPDLNDVRVRLQWDVHF